jgi:hypothetical protein
MNSFKLRLLTVAAFLFIVPSLGSAQTPEQVLSNPAMLRELRARIMSSGLTPDQVRARLRAEGYPENLLDAYLGTGEGASDAASTAVQTTPEDVLAAVAALGIVDTVDVTAMRCATALTDTTLTAADTVNIGRVNALARKAAIRQACQARQQRLANSDSATLRNALDSLVSTPSVKTRRSSIPI